MDNIRVEKVQDTIINHDDEFEKRVNDRKNIIPVTFCSELNDMIHGLKRKELVVVGGRPSNGKSVVLLNMAADCAKAGFNVHFFSLEMTLESCVARIKCREFGIDNELINTERFRNILTNPLYMEKMNELWSKIEFVRWTHSENFGKTFPEVLEMMDKFNQPDVIFVDYIQMIKRTARDSKESIEEYIKDIRNLAIEKNICVVVGSQMNRDSSKGNGIPAIHELKQTGALEEVADKVMLLSWPYLSDNEQPINDYFINVAKNRDGKTGNVKTKFYPQFSTVGVFNGPFGFNTK